MDFKKAAFYLTGLLSFSFCLSSHAAIKKDLSPKVNRVKASQWQRDTRKKLSDWLTSFNGYSRDVKVIPNIALGTLNINNSNDLRLSNTPAPGIVNRYEPSSSSYTDFLFGLNFSKPVANHKNNQIESWLGFEIDYIQPFSQYSGVVRPRVNVADNFDTVNFSYEIKSVAFLVNATFLQKNFSQGFGAYLNVGIGGALNFVSNYAEVVPVDSTAAAMAQPFGNASKGAFAFSVGFGLTETLANGAKVNFGYRYINTGHAQFDASTVQQTSNGLGSRGLQSNLFNISLIV